jgi:anti-sigma regulatory factor (Ser/Thr protein kinase)
MMPAEPRPFDHAALIVDSDDALRRRLIPRLAAHLAAGEPVMLVVASGTAQVIRASLGPSAERLEWGDPAMFYQRLGFAFESVRRYLQAQCHGGRSVHVILEPDVGTDLDHPVDRVAAYLAYESWSNHAYAPYGCAVTCVWDTRRHPTLVIEDVRSVHSYEITDTGAVASASFAVPDDYLAARAQVAIASPPSEVDVDLHLGALAELESARAVVWSWSLDRGFSNGASVEVVTAVGENIMNGFVHGRPPVRVRCWRRGETLIVQVDDGGGRPIPYAAGYDYPTDPARGKLGLWLARQLADVLVTHTAGGNTSVRMFFPYAVTHHGADRTNPYG